VAEFLAMGGYALYVWPAYGLAAVVLLGMVVQSHSRKRDVIKRLKQGRKL
jgi:heme exporter protein D